MYKQGNSTPVKGAPMASPKGGSMLSSSMPKGMGAKSTTFASDASESNKGFGDDIHCLNWLEEIGLPQYEETFSTNLSVGGDLLSRKRLSQIRLQDFPRMNITNYEHQKRLLEHIRHTLLFAYKSPIRKKEVSEKFPDAINKAESKSANTTNLKDLKNDLRKLDIDPSAKYADHRTGAIASSNRRRRSFDNSAWQSIDKLRAAEHHDFPTLEKLRAGGFEDIAIAPPKIEVKAGETGDKPKRTRRRSFGDNNSTTNKAILYGNMALEYDMIQKELALLQSDDLNKFRDIIGCEKASIFFINHKTAEMMLHADNQWFKIPVGSGIAGACAESGESLNIPDAYSDSRFSPQLDLKTGFRTRNMLCQAVRANRGGGHIIGVIQMLNKANNEDFNDNDEIVLDSCVAKVSDELDSKFKELLLAAELFSNHAVLLGKANRAQYNSLDSK